MSVFSNFHLDVTRDFFSASEICSAKHTQTGTRFRQSGLSVVYGLLLSQLASIRILGQLHWYLPKGQSMCSFRDIRFEVSSQTSQLLETKSLKVEQKINSAHKDRHCPHFSFRENNTDEFQAVERRHTPTSKKGYSPQGFPPGGMLVLSVGAERMKSDEEEKKKPRKKKKKGRKKKLVTFLILLFSFLLVSVFCQSTSWKDEFVWEIHETTTRSQGREIGTPN